MSIQSITIPSTTTRPSPKPHTAYKVVISTPVRSWDVWRRYSDFESLHVELKSEAGHDVDGAGLPGKHPWSFRSTVNDQLLIEDRRVHLEAYLRNILTKRDASHRNSHAFLDFLGAPPLPASTTTSSSSGRTTTFLPPVDTSPLWLAEHSALQSLSRSIRSSLSKRDALLESGNPQGGHTAGVMAKKDLAGLLRRVGGLATALEAGMKGERVGEGEMRRRGEMVGRLQDDCVSLGKLVATQRQPTAASSSSRDDAHHSGTATSSFFTDAPPTAQRNVLLGLADDSSHRPTVRTFGAPPPVPKGAETDETRPLDSGGIMHLQQTKIDQQDSMLTQLSTILVRQKVIAGAIGQEIAEQNELLDKLDAEVDTTSGKLGRAKRQMNRLN